MLYQSDAGVCTFDDGVVGDEAVADAGADRDHGEVVVLTADAEPVFGSGQGEQVVVDGGGQCGGFLERVS